MRELILGGQKSGKSRRAEDVARQWLAGSPDHNAVLIATALAGDDEMQQRIARHQADRADRAARLPLLQTVHAPLNLANAISTHSRSDTLVVVDCLTLWLTNCLMPLETDILVTNEALAQQNIAQAAAFLVAIGNCKGPLVIVSNELGQGVIPMGRDVRAFVDTLGRLHQDVAQRCERVTLMVAGIPMSVKGQA